MAGETVITIIGNLTADPELRFTQSGTPVASFTIASTPRTFNRQTGEWKNGQALFMRCSAWNALAENVAESLTKGIRVIAQGRLQQRSYTDREGVQRTVIDMTIDDIAPSLRYAQAIVERTRRQGQGRPQHQTQQQPRPTSYDAPPGGTSDDPWATAGATSFGDEPPF